MPEIFVCTDCGLRWLDGRTSCAHHIDAGMINAGIVLEPEGLFNGAVAQGDGDGGDGHPPTGEGSGGVDANPGVEGDTVGVASEGSAGADGAGEGREDASGGNPSVDHAFDINIDDPRQSNPSGNQNLLYTTRSDEEIRSSTVGTSRGNAISTSPGPERNAEKGVAPRDATDAGTRERFLANARRWLLGGVEGQQELFEYMKLNLVVNMQYDQEEGQDVRNPESKSAATQARANRKQFKETSELVMAIVQAQNEEAKKLEKT